MGTIRSVEKDYGYVIINGVTLAEPAQLEDGTYVWDHHMLPNGEIINGELVLDNDGPTEGI